MFTNAVSFSLLFNWRYFISIYFVVVKTVFYLNFRIIKKKIKMSRNLNCHGQLCKDEKCSFQPWKPHSHRTQWVLVVYQLKGDSPRYKFSLYVSKAQFKRIWICPFHSLLKKSVEKYTVFLELHETWLFVYLEFLIIWYCNLRHFISVSNRNYNFTNELEWKVQNNHCVKFLIIQTNWNQITIELHQNTVVYLASITKKKSIVFCNL